MSAGVLHVPDLLHQAVTVEEIRHAPREEVLEAVEA